jgi:hypothetical protein
MKRELGVVHRHPTVADGSITHDRRVTIGGPFDTSGRRG